MIEKGQTKEGERLKKCDTHLETRNAAPRGGHYV